MQRQTMVLGAVFAGLLVLILAIELVPEREKPRSATLSAVDWYDIDELTVSHGDKGFSLKRQMKSGDNPAKAEWQITKPIEWKAVRYKVLPMIKLFNEDRPSLRAFHPGKNKARYGFGKDAISVTVKSAGKLRNRFIVGHTKPTGSVTNPRTGRSTKTYETYIMFDKDEYVYQVAGDLRKPFRTKLNDLRNKRLFDFKPTAVQSVTITQPGAEKVELTSTLETTTDKKKTPKRTWAFKLPEGAKIDQQTARSFASRLSALSASSFKGKVDAKETYGITAKSPKVMFTVAGDKDGEHKVVQITLGMVKRKAKPKKPIKGKRKKKEPAFDYYATISGSNEVYQLSQVSYENLAKTHHHFLDKTLFDGLKPTEITNLELRYDANLMVLGRSKDSWTITSPKGYHPDAGEVKKLLKSLIELKAVEYDSAVTAETAGFDKPTLQLKIVDAKGKTHTLEVGKPSAKNKSRIYARVLSDGGKAVPFVLYKSIVTRFKKTPLDLQSKIILAFDQKTLSTVGLSWNHANKREALTLKRVVNGKSASWTILKPAPETAGDVSKINALVKRLGQLRANKFYPDKAPKSVGLTPDAALAMVVVTANNKTSKLLVSKKSDGAYYYAIGGNPRGVYSISKYVIKTLLKSKKELKGKGPVAPKTPTPKTPTPTPKKK